MRKSEYAVEKFVGKAEARKDELIEQIERANTENEVKNIFSGWVGYSLFSQEQKREIFKAARTAVTSLREKEST